MFVVPAFAEEPEGKGVTPAAAPIASLSPMTMNGDSGTAYDWYVSTTSAARPYKFYFDPGDGSGVKFSTYKNEASQKFEHIYPRTTIASKPYQTVGYVADQYSVSAKVYGKATIRSFY